MRPFLALCKFCESKSTLHHLGSQNKKFSFKSYSIFRDGIALFMNPVLGKVEEKGGYLNTNQGSMRIDLVPFEMEGGKVRLVITSRLQFLASVSNISNIIGLTDNQLCEEPFFIKFEYLHQTKWLTFKKQAKESEFVTIEVRSLKLPKSDTQGPLAAPPVKPTAPNTPANSDEDSLKINITKSELVVLRDLCKFTLPYLLGWHMLNPPTRATQHQGHA